VWLRTGNGSTATIAELLHSSVDIIARFMASEEVTLPARPDFEG